METLLLDLILIFLFSKIGGHIAVLLKQPSVLGEILVGILISPSILGLVSPSDILNSFSVIGVILLMFLAGLEIEIDDFKKSAKSSFSVASFGVLLPFGMGFLTGILLDLSTIQSLFLGVVLSATSVSISVQTMRELNVLKTKEGSTILGAAVLDDIIVMIILAFLLSFATNSDTELSILIFKKISFFFIAILFAWKFVPFLINKFSSLKTSEPVITGGIIICFMFSYFAEYTGVAAIIGSFIAGVSLSLTKFKEEIISKTESISFSIFVPVFFTYIGISSEFTNLMENLLLIILLSLIAIFTKLLGCGFGAYIVGFDKYSSLAIGSAMISRGEVALIVSSLGLSVGIINSELFSSIVFVVILSTLVTPPLMKFFFEKQNIKKGEA